MWKYVIKRILLICLTAFIVLSITYMLLQCLPVNEPQSLSNKIAFWDQQVSLGYCWKVPVEKYNLIETGQIIPTTDFTDDVGNRYAYVYYSIIERYGMWIYNIFTKWDWGVSTQIEPTISAMQIIMERLPVSMELNLISVAISTPLGILLGIVAALKKGKFTDDFISTVIMIFISVPSFVVISFLLIWFSYGLGWLPPQWPTNSEALADPTRAALAYIIPVCALSFGSIAGFARYTRAELCEVMSSEFLLLARTKGLTKGQSVVRHALRNSMVPIVPMIISQFISILSGSMILEELYNIPGIGNMFVEGINRRDFSVVMVDMAVYTLIGLFATLIVDLSYGVVDPRIRMGEAK